MEAPQLTRWHKSAVIGAMALLLGVWLVTVGDLSPAPAAGDGSPDSLPDVPTTAFSMPASVQPLPPGINPKEGVKGTLSNLSVNGIPTTALSAYRRAETLLAKADKDCRIPWYLIAAIGRVESNHGRTGGSALDVRGNATPPIIGIPLNGKNGTAEILDTDNGALDGDGTYDRAVGPMQFIPSTWKAVAVDANADGTRNPQNIYDAATAAGIYLCSGVGDLSTPAAARTAVLRYNNSGKYADLVLAISEAYKKGDFAPTTNGVPSGGGGGNTGSGSPSTTPSTGGSGGGGGNGGGNGGSGGNGGGGTTPTPTPKPKPTIAEIEASCREQYPKNLLDLLDTKYKACVTEQKAAHGYA